MALVIQSPAPAEVKVVPQDPRLPTPTHKPHHYTSCEGSRPQTKMLVKFQGLRDYLPRADLEPEFSLECERSDLACLLSQTSTCPEESDSRNAHKAIHWAICLPFHKGRKLWTDAHILILTGKAKTQVYLHSSIMPNNPNISQIHISKIEECDVAVKNKLLNISIFN